MANTIIVQNTPITVISDAERDYISLTDMAGAKNDSSRAADIIKNWMRARYTVEFLGTWESIHNSEFKVVEFDHFRKQAGLPSFVFSHPADVRVGKRGQQTYIETIIPSPTDVHRTAGSATVTKTGNISIQTDNINT